MRTVRRFLIGIAAIILATVMLVNVFNPAETTAINYRFVSEGETIAENLHRDRNTGNYVNDDVVVSIHTGRNGTYIMLDYPETHAREYYLTGSVRVDQVQLQTDTEVQTE